MSVDEKSKMRNRYLGKIEGKKIYYNPEKNIYLKREFFRLSEVGNPLKLKKISELEKRIKEWNELEKKVGKKIQQLGKDERAEFEKRVDDNYSHRGFFERYGMSYSNPDNKKIEIITYLEMSKKYKPLLDYFFKER